MPEPLKGPGHWSYSGASKWRECPAKWQATYIHHISDPPGPEAEIGTLAHEVLEHVGELPVGYRTLRAARRLADELWAGKATGWQRRRAWSAVAFALTLPITTDIKVYANEMSADCTLDGVPVVGHVDRVHTVKDGWGVLDWKSGKRREESRYRKGPRDQVTLYAAMLERIHGTPVKEGWVVWIGDGATTKPDRVATTDRAKNSAVEKHVGSWHEMQDALTSHVFEAKPSALCGWCPVVATCEPGQQMVRDRAAEGRSNGEHGLAFLNPPPIEKPVAAPVMGVAVEVLSGDRVRRLRPLRAS